MADAYETGPTRAPLVRPDVLDSLFATHMAQHIGQRGNGRVAPALAADIRVSVALCESHPVEVAARLEGDADQLQTIGHLGGGRLESAAQLVLVGHEASLANIPHLVNGTSGPCVPRVRARLSSRAMAGIESAGSRWLMLMLLSVLLASCDAAPSPTPTPTAPEPSAVEVSVELITWAQGARDMVWRHLRPGPPPNLSAARIETCADYAIAFFHSTGGELLWAAGRLSESPEGADGGFVSSAGAEALAADRREGQAGCRVVFDVTP